MNMLDREVIIICSTDMTLQLTSKILQNGLNLYPTPVFLLFIVTIVKISQINMILYRISLDVAKLDLSL